MNITEDSLQELVSEAFAERTEQIQTALEWLQEMNAEVAELVREMHVELTELRRGSIDVDAATTLSEASRRLGCLGDDATTLIAAARMLGNLGHYAAQVKDAAVTLPKLSDTAERLWSTARGRRGLHDDAALLSSAADDIDRAVRRAQGFM